jgi:hypothetical protein
MLKKFISLSNLTLLVALSLSTVAAYYSIIGLTAIFAGAVIPIIVMGSILEVGKITTTVWLRKYWHRCGWVLKMYLVPAVVLLALLTSMGIFGFLSKAHMDQGITSGDSQAKLALYDEKIKTQKDNVELARKALSQMDAQVDQMLGRTDNDKGAERAVQIRRQQAKERTALQNDIAVAQKEIQKLNEERAPIAAENRKVEAEVGPIKYIAALIYGDNADQNMLEAAVRWVIILLVVVFDPLAIALVLAANASKDWDDETEQDVKDVIDDLATIDEFVNQAALDTLKEVQEAEDANTQSFNDPGEHPKDNLEYEEPKPEPINDDRPLFDKYPYLEKSFTHFTNMRPMVANMDEYLKNTEVKEPTVDGEVTIDKEITADSEQKILTLGVDVVDRPGDYVTPPAEIITEGVTRLEGEQSEYAIFEGKSIRKDALKEMHPEMFKIAADGERKSNSNFGTKFPELANKGDTFVRVDVLPNRVYKFDGKRWIEINKETTDTYLHDREYIKHLVSMIETGQYDVDLLSESEQREIENYVRAQNT